MLDNIQSVFFFCIYTNKVHGDHPSVITETKKKKKNQWTNNIYDNIYLLFIVF